MMKLQLLLVASLLSITSAAFVNPSSSRSVVTPAVAAAVKFPTATSLFVSTTPSNDDNNLPTLAAATVMTFLIGAAAPLAAFAEEAGDYEYGAVAAPGGIGLAVGLGVLAVSVLSFFS